MDYLSSLNQSQYKACVSDATYLRIIAGAGTGKTQTLSNRIAYFILEKNIKPKEIVAITFTTKAAKEMLNRVNTILKKNSKKELTSSPLITTFHGFCYRFLKKEISNLNTNLNTSFSVIDDEDQNRLFKDIFSFYSLDNNKDLCQQIVSIIKHKKSEGILPDQIDSSDEVFTSVSYRTLLEVYSSYQENLIKQNLVDFDDLIIYTKNILLSENDVRLYWQQKFKMFFIDEFQDTDKVQYELVKLLLDKINSSTRLTVVGDPDQTIYTWRGADNHIIKDLLPRDFPSLESIVLDENYRSTKQILDVANKLISFNNDRLKKDLVPFDNKQGEKVKLLTLFSATEEAKYIVSEIKSLVSNKGYKYSDFALLYRSNYLSNSLEKQLVKNAIPYEVYGGMKFYERKEIKDTLAYLKILINPSDDMSFLRTLSAPSKGIGEVTLSKAKDIAREKNISLMEVFASDEIKLSSNAKKAIDSFLEIYNKTIKDNIDDYEVIDNYFTSLGLPSYIDNLDKADKNKNDLFSSGNERKENYLEFINEIKTFLEEINIDYEGNESKNTLSEFVNNISLQSSQDLIKDDNSLILSTCHVAKGLEFKVVYLCGVNEGIFPTSYSINETDPKSLEEERRLCYVAYTRARERLVISTYKLGTRPGSVYVPSRFIKESGLESYNFKRSIDNGNNPFSSVYSPSNFIGASSLLNDKKKVDLYHIGDRVSHEKYGLGYVVDLDKNVVVINFDAQEGLRKFVIDAPQLKKYGE